MSASEKVAETTKEVVVDVAEEVAGQAEHFAEFARRLNKTKLQFGILGVTVGAAMGAIISFHIAYRKAETKYSKITEDEIADMREHYQAKGRALEAEAAKRPVEDIVKERGYSSSELKTVSPPMAIQPPEQVIESEDEAAGEPSDDPSDSEVRNIFQETKVEYEWDYHEERRRRSPDIPYVIHYDERYEIEGYSEMTLTYYTIDDVLCNERDEVIDPLHERDNLIGEGNLDRFGHGSNDASIVYIRNDEKEVIFEVVKSPNSFAEEVHGFQHGDYLRGNLERMRARERDEPED